MKYSVRRDLNEYTKYFFFGFKNGEKRDFLHFYHILAVFETFSTFKHEKST